MRAPLCLLAAMSLLGLCAACGDDAAVVVEGDAGRDAGSGPDAIPRPDAGMPAGKSAVPMCDRYDATSCSSGTVCNEVAEVVPGQADPEFYAGCIEVSGLRGLGAPCAPWSDRYGAVSEEVYYDPCGDGLVCSNDPEVRGSTSCQLACQSGVFGDAFVGCDSDTAYCQAIGPAQDVCVESDECDPFAKTGCPDSQACYLRLNDGNDGYLTQCLPIAAKADLLPDYESCVDASTGVIYLNRCHPGSSCTGPVHLAPDEWVAADFACRPLCDGVSDDLDAGTDDAGAAGGCVGAAECVPFTESSLGFGRSAQAPFGQCER